MTRNSTPVFHCFYGDGRKSDSHCLLSAYILRAANAGVEQGSVEPIRCTGRLSEGRVCAVAGLISAEIFRSEPPTPRLLLLLLLLPAKLLTTHHSAATL